MSAITAVVTIDHGKLDIDFCPDSMNVLVVDLDADNQLFLYKGNIVCKITKVNGDGTVNVRCTDSIDKSTYKRILIDVPAGDLEVYSDDDSFDDDLDEMEL